jgi:LCP family protein required for cell wall assembly
VDDELPFLRGYAPADRNPPPRRDPRKFFVPAGTTSAPPRADKEPAAPARPRPPDPPRSEPEHLPRAKTPPAEPRPAVRVPAPDEAPARPTGPRHLKQAPKRSFFRRGKARWVVLGALLLPIVLLMVGLLWANTKFNSIDRVEVGSLLDAGGSGTNYLIVGSDSREGVDPNGANAGAILGEGAPDGQRSDTMLVMRVEGGESKLLSIPRDLWVRIAETDSSSRINTAYRGGPGRLVKTVQASLGVPVNRYLEVDFVTFAGLVDAIGGVTINFPFPASDPMSGLDVKEAGDVELDGTQALAYVRSRQYTETIDGRQVTDATADLGRVQRQQQFLRAVLGKAGGSRNPFTLMKVANAVAGGLRIDDKMSFTDALRFAWRMGRLDPQSTVLPVEQFRTNGGAAVLRLLPGADAVLAEFRG